MRLDAELVRRQLARSRDQARELVLDGAVQVSGRVVRKPSAPVSGDDEIVVGAKRWVSRAAMKLVGALDASETSVPARCLDAGAAAGGFTQALLERGAEVVYAVDVGKDQLADQIRSDPRVRVREGVNLRDLSLDHLEGMPVQLVVADVSFISQRLLAARLLGALTPDGEALLLVKPQFEVGRERLGRNGVVADERLREEAVEAVVAEAERLGWECRWRGDSVVAGKHGNRELFIALRRRAQAPV